MQRAAPAAVSAPSQRPAQPVPSIRGYLNRSHLPAAFQSAIQPGQRQASTAAPQPQAAGRSGPPGSSGQQQPPPAHVDQQQQQREAAAPDRRPAQLAAVAGLAAIGAACYATLSAQPELPPLDAVLGPAAAVLLGGPALALLLAKAVLRDRLQVELHRGRLYLSAGMPLSGLPLAPGAVAVRPTGDVRGNGAYATALIPAGTYLGDYTGEVLDRRAFFSRHPDGVGDYAMAIDDEWTIDAAARVADTSNFHLSHLNHSRGRANVRRYYRRAEQRISFFTDRDVQPGEELLFDYGRAYWRGREDQELP